MKKRKIINMDKFIILICIITLIISISGCSNIEKPVVSQKEQPNVEIKKDDGENDIEISKENTNENKDNQGTEEPSEVESETEQNTSNEETTEEVSQPEDSNSGEEVATFEEKPIEVVEILKSSKVPSLTLEEHKPISETSYNIKDYKPSSFAPLYLDTWRMQIVNYSTSSGKAVGTFEIGNLSNKPLVITKENIQFIRSAGGADVAKSYIEGGSITIGPNEIKTVNVISPNIECSLIDYSIRGAEGTFLFDDGDLVQEITDTTPMNTVRENGVVDAPFIKQHGLVAGNGDFKVHVREIIMTDNESIGSLKRPKSRYGRIGMAKLRFANTSSETIELEKVMLFNDTPEEKENEKEAIYLSLKDLSALGENAFPTSIKPNKIVEGYIPFIVEDGNETSMMTIKTSKGYIYITNLEVMPVKY